MTFDVLIVGAGISGIGAAHYLRQAHPQRCFAILEARGAVGGTWDLFRYPGIRSDSDLYTFGYEFRPWTGPAIASGPAILEYLRSVVNDEGLAPRIRFHHRVVAASWSTQEARWTLEVERTDTGERLQRHCRWLFAAGGYFRYDRGHHPDLEGQDEFAGKVVHPQFWPEDLDCSGRRIVVIGSGATAVTLVPALAGTAEHVTMVQRTPTYVLPVPSQDRMARRLQRWLGPERAMRIARERSVLRQRWFWRLSRRHPQRMRRFIRWVNTKSLPKEYPVDVHFKPPYDPWDQRLCIAPDGDFFSVLADGSASIVTGEIERFTRDGILLRSGAELHADIVVMATGLEIQPMGGMAVNVDGERVDVADRVVFKGMMLSGVPNFSYVAGYVNASWTLKVGLVSRHFTALLSYMDAHGYTICRPEPTDPDMPTRPALDFGSGYVRRASDRIPRQGEQWPWTTVMDHIQDRKLLSPERVADAELVFK